MRRAQQRKKAPPPSSDALLDAVGELMPPRHRVPTDDRGPQDPWDIWYFRRHSDDDPAEAIPGRDFLRSCPPGVRADFVNVLIAVAKAPPNRFSGGGKWEAMHDEMKGFYEIRAMGPGKRLYRLFCLLDHEPGLRSLLVVIDGRSKPNNTKLAPKEYAQIRRLGDEFRARLPRSVC